MGEELEQAEISIEDLPLDDYETVGADEGDVGKAPEPEAADEPEPS